MRLRPSNLLAPGSSPCSFPFAPFKQCSPKLFRVSDYGLLGREPLAVYFKLRWSYLWSSVIAWLLLLLRISWISWRSPCWPVKFPFRRHIAQS